MIVGSHTPQPLGRAIGQITMPVESREWSDPIPAWFIREATRDEWVQHMAAYGFEPTEPEPLYFYEVSVD